jgi:hypothetical protein
LSQKKRGFLFVIYAAPSPAAGLGAAGTALDGSVVFDSGFAALAVLPAGAAAGTLVPLPLSVT